MAQESGLPQGWAEVLSVCPPQTCTGCGKPGHKKGWRPITGAKTTGAFYGDCCGGLAASTDKPAGRPRAAKRKQ